VAAAMAADLNAAAAAAGVPLGGGHCLKITAFPYHHNLMHARNVSLQITAKFVMLMAYIMIPYYILSSHSSGRAEKISSATIFSCY
jgi:hypothetical protein